MRAGEPTFHFSPHDRDAILGRLISETFDLIVIGGGITGAGVARDAASRGMKVALIEARDFAEGTSSRSSKLIHGGIRYLENLEFGLVFEALSERRLLFEIAPHLVHPLRFVLPLYKGDRIGMFKMGLGMWLYDALSLFEAPELHERLSDEETLERLPLLRKSGLLGSYAYSDAYMDDARMVIETLRSAVALGAACINYVSAEDAELVEGKVKSVGCKEMTSGRRFRIRGRHVISTVGPWTDIAAPRFVGEWNNILRPSKGVHLTFDRNRFPLKQAVVMAADQQKRIVFGIPRHEMVIVGTTDTDYAGDPGDVTTTAKDVEYLLKVTDEYFPEAKITAKDIIATYAGVRPLVRDEAETESKTSREHLILKDPRNVTFVAGGKYTTYRLMAEQAVAAALESFPIEFQVRFARNDTKHPLNPLATTETMAEALRLTPAWAKEFGLNLADVETLVGRHGLEALKLLEKDQRHGPDSRELSSEERVWVMEARHAIQTSMCLHLIDFYARRTHLFLARPDHGLIHMKLLSSVFASELGWSDSKRQEEEEALRIYVRRELSWKQDYGLSPAAS